MSNISSQMILASEVKMTLCRKCNKRKQHTFPNKKVIGLCAVCAWELIEEFLNSPDEQATDVQRTRESADKRFNRWLMRVFVPRR